MSEKAEKETVGKKLNSFIERHRKSIIITVIVIVVLLVLFIVGYLVANSNKEKNLAKIDTITFTLVDGSKGLADSELDARRDTAIADLQELVSKGGIVGARANMLCAELSYQLNKVEDAVNYWKATAEKSKKSYIQPIANYNLGVCYENLGNKEEASNYYKLAADDEDFVLGTHARFSYGRSLESLGNYTEAVEVYKALNDKDPSDSWAKLAKSRIIELQIEGKAE